MTILAPINPDHRLTLWFVIGNTAYFINRHVNMRVDSTTKINEILSSNEFKAL